VTTITRHPASSVYPEPGTPHDAPDTAGPHPAEQAALQWRMFAPVIAGRDKMRLSYDGGRNYPRNLEKDLASVPPPCPTAVYVYDDDGNTRLLTADFDVKRAASRGAANPADQVTADAAAFAHLIRTCGGRGFGDISPNGGRHAYVLWATALPYTEMRRVALALALRYPSLDPSPMLGREHGLIRPPGSRHRSGGHQLLTTALPAAERAIAGPNGFTVWTRLLSALAAELMLIDAGTSPLPATAALEVADAPRTWHIDDTGMPWLPRPGGPLPRLRADLETAAVAGVFDSTRYGTDRSAARFAILCSAATRGWRLTDVTARLQDGTWPGLAGFYARYSRASRVRELAADWKKAVAWAAGTKSARASNTRENTHTGGCPPQQTATGRDGAYQIIRRWEAALRAGEQQRWRGPHGITIRLVMRAVAAAAQMIGSTTIEFGTRSLAMLAGVDHSTVARVLREVREEPDSYLDLMQTSTGPGREPARSRLRGDLYRLRIPDQFSEASNWPRWRRGLLGVHPVFRILGGPAALVFEQLTTSGPTRTSDLPVLTGLSRSTVSAALAVLGSEGLAQRLRGGWSRGPADPDDIADRLGVPQILADVAARHRSQRQQWRVFVAAIATFPAAFWDQDWTAELMLEREPVLAGAPVRGPPRLSRAF
jgi:hypothetical protein